MRGGTQGYTGWSPRNDPGVAREAQFTIVFHGG
jgi:hypothetical protein